MNQTGGTPGEGNVTSPSHQCYQETVDRETTGAACLFSLRVSRESEKAGATGLAQVCRQGAAQLAGGGANVLGGLCGLSECGLQLLQVTQTQLD